MFGKKFYSSIKESKIFRSFIEYVGPDVFKFVILPILVFILIISILSITFSITLVSHKEKSMSLETYRYEINNLIEQFKEKDCCDTTEKIKYLLRDYDVATDEFGKKLIMKNYAPNGRQILTTLKILKINLEKLKGYVEKEEEIESEVESIEKRLNVLPTNTKFMELKTVVIIRMFDVDKLGNGYFEAADMDLEKRIVLFGKYERLRKYHYGDYLRLWLIYAGAQPFKVTHSNVYGSYETTEYEDVYMIVPPSLTPNKIKAARKKLKEELAKNNEKLQKIKQDINEFMNVMIYPQRKKILMLTYGKKIE